MGGERASTSRLRLAGKICANCGISIPDPPRMRGERLCAKCTPPSTHRIYMYYMLRAGWVCQFLEEDLKTPLAHRLHFKDAEKIRAIVDKVGSFANLQDRQALDYGLNLGRGGVWLRLTEEQYQRLKSGANLACVKPRNPPMDTK
ncbi:MAG: hypothetical protein JST28_16960 [Acidobacteria bacterium]|nr:hypothetical protein [Acidobacteriota bacterium]